MQPADILEALRSPQDRIPEEALLAAMDQPEAVIPGLLALLEDTLAEPAAHVEETGHIFALYLLAQFREPKALPLVQALLRLPEDQQDDLLGDLITEGMPSILASLAGHDPAALEAMAADKDLDTFVRMVAMDALLVLGFKGVISELALVDAFDTLLTLFEARGRQETPEAWAFLAGSCSTAGFTPFLERLQAAHNRGLIDPSILGLEDMESGFTASPGHARRRFLKAHHPVEDALLDLEDQGWFAATDDDEEDDEIAIPTLAPEALQTIIARQGPLSAHDGPSRKGPCPCGSGKKYKRCCGKV